MREDGREFKEAEGIKLSEMKKVLIAIFRKDKSFLDSMKLRGATIGQYRWSTGAIQK